MNKYKGSLLFLLRLSLGWLLVYAGYSKITNPDWTAAGFLNNAKTFPEFYAWLASPSVLPITDFLNSWGQLLLGIALILGVVMTLSSILAAIMMLLYYLTALQFPFVGEHGFIVDEHIIYGLSFLVLAALGAGQYYGLGNWWSGLAFWNGHPRLKTWLT